MSGIFINYRRDDSAPWAGRLFERLARDIHRSQLLMDVVAIELGLDFVRELEKQVSSCDVMLVIIGPRWIEARNEQGSRRLDDPQDFVRVEIATALRRDIRVIPVLIDGADMPRPEALPDPLKALAFRNAVQISHARFGADTQGLVDLLLRIVPSGGGVTSWFRRAKRDDPHSSSGKSGAATLQVAASPSPVPAAEWKNAPRPLPLLSRGLLGFISGAMAVLIFHQGVYALLPDLGLASSSITPWSLAPVSPWGVPRLLNLMFWGGLWGILFSALYRWIPGRWAWLKGFSFGAFGPLLLGSWITVPLLKGFPLFANFNVNFLRNGIILVAVAFGVGLGLFYSLLRRSIR